MINFISKRQFSNFTGISISTIDRGIKEQTWPFNKCIRIGRRVLYPFSVLAEMEAKAAENAAASKVEEKR
jgi:predicted DNA-binding transcriptional regulator AlpA